MWKLQFLLLSRLQFIWNKDHDYRIPFTIVNENSAKKLSILLELTAETWPEITGKVTGHALYNLTPNSNNTSLYINTRKLEYQGYI